MPAASAASSSAVPFLLAPARRIVRAIGRTAARGASGLVLLAATVLAAMPAVARMPDAYGAIRVQAGPGEAERRFDLRPAIEQARKAGKPILLYVGAHDCPYCRVLERSFGEHADRLAPRIRARYVMVEIEGWLRGPKRIFVLPDGEFPIEALNARLGVTERGRRFIWPSFFALDPATMKSIKPMSEGNNRYVDPDEAEVELDLL